MSPHEAAQFLGVSHTTIRRTMKRTGMRWTVPLHKGVYDLTNGDVARIARVLLNNNRLAHGQAAFVRVRLQDLSASHTSDIARNLSG